PKFSDRAHALFQLLKSHQAFLWNTAQQQAFEDLKATLCKSPVLAHYNPTVDIELHTDASSVGLGAVLIQPNSTGKHPACYASRTLTKAETRRRWNHMYIFCDNLLYRTS